MKQRIMRGVFLVGLAILAVHAQANLIALWHRNYTGNELATNRSWFYKYPDGSPKVSGDGFYPLLEWETTRTENFPVVYLRGSTATIELKFMNPQPFSRCVGTLELNGARLRIPPVSAGGSDTYVTLSASLVGDGDLDIPADGGFDTVSITISGLPDYVTRGYIEVDAKVQGGPIQYWTTGGFQTWEKAYLTEGEPTGLQDIPWTDVHEYSCAWANGTSGAFNVTEEATDGLFWGPIFAYNLGTAGVPFRWRDGATGKYMLKALLDAVSSFGKQDGSCVDASYFLEIALEGLGIPAQCNRLYYTYPAQDPFITNLMCPIGSDATNPGLYWHVAFSMHQQCYVGGLVNDAAVNLRKNAVGAFDVNPPSLWAMPSYWQTWAGTSPAETYGLVYRELVSTDTLYLLTVGGKIVSTGVTPDATIPPRMISHIGPTITNHNGIK